MENEITHGRVTIARQAHKEVTVYGKKITYKRPITFPVMRVDDQLVMSGSPQERLMMEKESKSARGRALVAGLGLGVILDIIRPHCDRIVVIEKHADVIEAYKKFKNGKPAYDVVILASIEDVLDKTVALPPQFEDNRFDYIHLDTWYQLDYEDLPHINWMIQQAGNLLRPMGRIEAWGVEWMQQGFRKECASVLKNRKHFLRKPKSKIATLKEIFPVMGEFIEWFQSNPRATMRDARPKIEEIGSRVKKSQYPLEVNQDIQRIKWAWKDSVPVMQQITARMAGR